jgi:hypothetical protein
MVILLEPLLTCLQALPDRVITPEPVVDNDDVSGGVSLLEPQAAAEDSSKQSEVALPTRPAPAPAAEITDRRFVLVKGAGSSYNTGTMRSSAAPPKQTSKLSATNLQRGDLAAPHHHFTPIQALAKYPYRFCDKSLSQDIASAFFDGGKFWDREWDL